MRRTGALLLGSLLIAPLASGQVASLPNSGVGQPPRDNLARAGTARIRGRVIAADTGAPLRKAIVRAFSPELRDNKMATTDAQGVYEIRDLPAGRYNLNASKGSYVSLGFGQTRPNQQGRPLELLENQTLEKVDFALPRGSVITGRVVDEFGEPVADVMVMPLRQMMQQGRRRLTPMGRQSQTNDIGEFRIFGLSPGSYYISATFRSGYFTGDDDHSGYAPTYYPGTPNAAEAQRITVGVGQTVSDVTMALVVTRTARISGTVVDAQGQPITRGGVNVMQRTGAMGFMGGYGGPIKPDGTFVVQGVAPGDYTLRANVQGDGNATQFASANVTVNGEDVAGVQLAVAKSATITGRFVVADPAAAQSLKPAALNIFLSPMDPDDGFAMMGGPPRIKDDFTFEAHVAASGRFRANVGGTANFFVKAVRQGGIDVTDTGIDVEPGRDASDIEIELTNRPASVSGMVTNARGETASDYSVIVFAQDREKWTPPTRYSSIGRPDQEGRFKIRSLPAGDFYAIAVDAYNQEDFGDPDFFDRLKDRATRFSIIDGETKVIDLKLERGS